MSTRLVSGRCAVCRKRDIPSHRIHMKLRTCSEACQLNYTPQAAADHMIASARAATSEKRLVAKKYGGVPVSHAASFVYLLYAPRTSQYKIGVSVNVEKRANTLSTSAGIPIDIVDYWELNEVSYTTESALHEHYSKYRTIGEWFDFGDMDQERIRSSIERLINGYPDG